MFRRNFLKAAAACASSGAVLSALPVLAQAKPKTVAFDHAWLKNRARTLATKPYVKRSRELPAPLRDRGWEQFHFRPERALWGDRKSPFSVQFFHRSQFFRERVDVFEVVAGRAAPVAYDLGMFDYERAGVRPDTLPRDLGFAGFRLLLAGDSRDVTSFLGASYFRAVAGNFQWGLSARGLAIDTALKGRTEEFPMFTCFWLERPAADATTLNVYALLDSESITGAYRFAITPGKSQVMDIEATLYPRKAIERLGIGPGTSMYQCGENDRRMAHDVRPELHDSDGLAIWTGSGEWIWRPLTNPTEVAWNAFVDQKPRGFGLLQRDQNFESYQDDQLFYDRRPGLWVEPRSDWGRGSVQLVEIPTTDETNDNVVSFWSPEQAAKPGQELAFSYRLHWGMNPPVSPQLATTTATRLGLGGPLSQRTKYSCRFMVDFSSDAPPPAAARGPIEAAIQASRGTVELVSARVLHVGSSAAPTRYRAVFDVVPPDDSTARIELRMFLRAGGQPLTETWLYHWHPPAASDRKLY